MTRTAGQQIAHSAVYLRVKRGLMPRASSLKCTDCGAAAHEYDHRDYNKLFDVEPVCRRCNQLRGPAAPRRSGPRAYPLVARYHCGKRLPDYVYFSVDRKNFRFERRIGSSGYVKGPRCKTPHEAETAGLLLWNRATK